MAKAARKPGKGHNSGNPAHDARLRSFVERLENLAVEAKKVRDDMSEVKKEAKGLGFDVPTIMDILRLRQMSPQRREEREALLDIYKAALGMLYDTPLGEAARKRLAKPPEQDDDAESGKEDAAPADAKEPEVTDEVIAKAREEGRAAAKKGIPVTDNPFPARDKRRAAWDEGWCAESGSDGMEIPTAWRRSKPKKPGEEPEGEDDNGSDDDEGGDE